MTHITPTLAPITGARTLPADRTTVPRESDPPRSWIGIWAVAGRTLDACVGMSLLAPMRLDERPDKWDQ